MASIYLRKKTWWISYYKSPGEKPTQHSLKTKDKTVAKFKKNEIESRLSHGVNPLPDLRVHLDKILDEYEAHCAGVNKKKTVTDDIARIRALIDWTGCQRAMDMTEARVKEYVNHRIETDEISHETANRIITNTKTFLNFAIKRNYIGQNPLKSMRKYSVDRLPPKYLTKPEIKAILEAAGDNPLLPMITAAIYSGMRLGELKRLSWNDVDMARDQITIKLAKSGKFRTVPLHPELKKTLISGKGDKTKLIFDCTNLRRLFWRVCVKSGNFEKVKVAGGRARMVPTIGWHTFRHTFASQLVLSGVDLVTVSKLLGHSDIQTTMIYSHLSQEHVKDSIKRLQF